MASKEQRSAVNALRSGTMLAKRLCKPQPDRLHYKKEAAVHNTDGDTAMTAYIGGHMAQIKYT